MNRELAMALDMPALSTLLDRYGFDSVVVADCDDLSLQRAERFEDGRFTVPR